MIDNEVRDMLDRRAGDVHPSPRAWDRIQDRISEDRPQRSHAPRLLIAAALLVAVAVTGLLVSQPDGDQRVDTNRPAASSTTTAPPPVPAVSSVPAVWPATTDAGLAARQADADGGRRPDLLDPQAAAGGYLSDLFLTVQPKVDFSVGEYRSGDSRSGEVAYLAGKLPGSVLVRRLGGENGIWYVVGLTHLRIEVTAAQFDGTRFTAEALPRADGLIDISVADGSGAGRGLPRREVRSGQVVMVDETLSGRAVVIARFTLRSADGVVSVAEVRADVAASAPTATPAPSAAFCELMRQTEGERPPSYVGSPEHVDDLMRLQASAPPEVAANVARVADYIRGEVDPARPDTQLTEDWPAEVRAAIGRIEEALVLCSGGRRP